MRKQSKMVIRQKHPDGTQDPILAIVPKRTPARPARQRQTYTVETTPARFWSVSEAPPGIPWDARPGKGLRPRRRHRIRTLRPGDPGTRGLLAQFGDRLVAVRYVYDSETGKRTKTVELRVEEADWVPERLRIAPDQPVGLRIGFEELELRDAVKTAGGKWDRTLQVWVLPYRKVKALGLCGRVTHSCL
jgi:hypothetical protein